MKISVWSMGGGGGRARGGCGAHAVGKVEQREAQEECRRHKWLETEEKLLNLMCYADCGGEVVKG